MVRNFSHPTNHRGRASVLEFRNILQRKLYCYIRRSIPSLSCFQHDISQLQHMARLCKSEHNLFLQIQGYIHSELHPMSAHNPNVLDSFQDIQHAMDILFEHFLFLWVDQLWIEEFRCGYLECNRQVNHILGSFLCLI